MSGAVALVMPSKLESFGIPYYEAMAIGCPVIAADFDFAREACGEAGFYANPDDGREFAHYVDTLVNAPSVLKTVSRNLRDRSLEIGVSWKEVASQYIDLLEKLR